MSTETDVNAPDDLTQAFAAGVDDIRVDQPTADPPPKQETEQTAAPSTEGVVTTGAEKTEPEKPAEAETQKRRALNELKNDEILAMLKSGDPDAQRAVELRLKRLERTQRPPSKALAQMEEKGRAVSAGLDRIATDYPDIAAGLAPMKEFVETVQVPLREAEQQAAIQEAQAHIEKMFPNFVQVVSNEQFPAWLKTQSQDVQRAFAGGGTDGAFVVLDAYDTYVINQGKPSPFAPQPSSAPAPAAPDLQAKAAQIIERRQQALKSSAAVPTGSRAINTDDDLDPSSAWSRGVADVAKSSQGFRR